MEVEELEQYLAALVELKRKVLMRVGDLANMENASMLSLGSSSYSNNLPNTFDNAHLNMQIFGDGIKIQNNTINDLDFGDGIKFENNTINVPTSYLDFGDGIKFVSNTMNGPKNGLDFGDGIKFENNTMNGLTMFENNTMNGLTNDLDFGDGINFENNTMNGPTNGLDLEMESSFIITC
ncbi:agamous-like MADS-box protein AGL62 [Tanacetum coccineum]